MATQRLLSASPPADSMVQIISLVGARRRELRASTGERLLSLAARTLAAEMRYAVLAERLTRLEHRLAGLEQAREAHMRPLAATPRPRQRGVHPGREREVVGRPVSVHHGRDPEVGGRPRGARWQLGSALMLIGGLVVLWVALLEVGLALGL